ncbi:choice-of-anchor D domain-containing protein, partial [Verrucomicrobiota bacterium]
MVKFDITSIPAGSLIDSCKLHLYVNTAERYRVADSRIYLYGGGGAWDESTVTWATRPGSSGGALDNVLHSDLVEGTWLTLTVKTNLVQTWLDNPASNYGLCFKRPFDGLSADYTDIQYFRAFFASSEDTTPSHRPKLEISYSPSEPELDVYGNGIEIVDGDSIPAGADDTDFGNTFVGGSPVSHVFTITNSGRETLNLSGTPKVQLSGHTGDFTVTSQPGSSTVAAGASTTFTVEFDPTTAGTRSATVSIANSDSDENPYNFDIQGVGDTPAPEMAVLGDGQEITDGDNLPSASDGTEYGDVVVGQPLDQVFVITNSGVADLILSGSPRVTISGNADFTVTSQPSTPITPGNSASFTIRFVPAAAGVRTAEVSIANDDSDENPYNFALQGRGIDPPVVNSGAATDVGPSAATLNGTLSDGVEADVYVYWGDTDGGTDPAQWSNTGVLSSVSQGGFTYPLSGLDLGATYYYNFYAENIAGTDWAASDSFTTLSVARDFKIHRGTFTMTNYGPTTVTLTNGYQYTLS